MRKGNSFRAGSKEAAEVLRGLPVKVRQQQTKGPQNPAKEKRLTLTRQTQGEDFNKINISHRGGFFNGLHS